MKELECEADYSPRHNIFKNRNRRRDEEVADQREDEDDDEAQKSDSVAFDFAAKGRA